MSDNILDADDLFEDADDLFEEANESLDPVHDFGDPVEDFGEAVEDVAEAGSDEVGMTSQEAKRGAAKKRGAVNDGNKPQKKKRRLGSFSVYDGLLLISLICVCLATLILFLDLSKFGSLTEGFPWRTTEFSNQ